MSHKIPIGTTATYFFCCIRNTITPAEAIMNMDIILDNRKAKKAGNIVSNHTEVFLTLIIDAPMAMRENNPLRSHKERGFFFCTTALTLGGDVSVYVLPTKNILSSLRNPRNTRNKPITLYPEDVFHLCFTVIIVFLVGQVSYF